MNDLRMMHKTIKKVGEDIENLKFNTAIASLMEWLNYLSCRSLESGVTKEEYGTFLKLLSPFAPHITEELWAQIGEKDSIHKQSWPKSDSKHLQTKEFSLVIQVNGKLRDMILIDSDIIRSKESIEKLAGENKNAAKFLDGKSVKRVVYIEGRLINFVV